MITIKYDNQQYEYYTLSELASDLSSGDFDYDNSLPDTIPVHGKFYRLGQDVNMCPK